MTGGVIAICAVIASFWRTLQGAWVQLSSKLVAQSTFNGEDVQKAIILWLRENTKTSKLQPRLFEGMRLNVKPKDRVELVPLEAVPEGGRLYRRGWRFMYVSLSNSSSDGRSRSGSSKLVIRFIRGTFNIETLIKEATARFNEIAITSSDKNKRFRVQYCSGVMKPALTFDAFLNIIDGFEKSDGILL